MPSRIERATLEESSNARSSGSCRSSRSWFWAMSSATFAEQVCATDSQRLIRRRRVQRHHLEEDFFALEALGQPAEDGAWHALVPKGRGGNPIRERGCGLVGLRPNALIRIEGEQIEQADRIVRRCWDEKLCAHASQRQGHGWVDVFAEGWGRGVQERWRAQWSSIILFTT